MNILLLDYAAYKPYTANTMREGALGGSEASLIRVARGLAKRGHDVSVFQNIDSQRATAMVDLVRHVGVASEFPTPDVVIHFRGGATIPIWREMFPEARHLMWTQDFFTKDSYAGLEGEEIVCLSHAHREQVILNMPTGMSFPLPKIIYNMVEIDGAKLDKVPGRLGFFSSPHKGLDQVLSLFGKINEERNTKGLPSFELVIGNPGYLPGGIPIDPNAPFLGELSHPRVLEELSRCEVLFYPQSVFPETMGIVLAEANAMGVPVLCHDFGAAAEVLDSHTNVVTDCTDANKVRLGLDLLLNGSQPKPTLDPRFTETAVIDAWEALLCPPTITT